jgi:hypothetical protein
MATIGFAQRYRVWYRQSAALTTAFPKIAPHFTRAVLCMTLGPARLALLPPFLLCSLCRPRSRAAEGPTDCAGAARPGWSPAESWVWRQICAGATAELDKGAGVPDASRKLSPTFMTALFFDPQLKALIPHSGVHIAGGEIDFPLNLTNATPGYELSLERMRFAGDVDLHGLSAAENISFANSRFLGSVDLDGGSFACTLSLVGAMSPASSICAHDHRRLGGVRRIAGQGSTERIADRP